jgi:hypothetical protein
MLPGQEREVDGKRSQKPFCATVLQDPGTGLGQGITWSALAQNTAALTRFLFGRAQAPWHFAISMAARKAGGPLDCDHLTDFQNFVIAHEFMIVYAPWPAGVQGISATGW